MPRFFAPHTDEAENMIKRLITIVIAIAAIAASGWSAANEQPQSRTLRDLKNELQTSYVQIPRTQEYYDGVYARRQDDTQRAMNTFNTQSILLYTQERHRTFNMAYVLKQVSSDYKAFHERQHAYDRDTRSLTYQIERYRRLTASLDDIPTEDSLNMEDKAYRDSCIYYASELLRMYETNRDKILSDSTYHQTAAARLKANYDYAIKQYQELKTYIFREGQSPYLYILKHFGAFWDDVKADIREEYDIAALSQTEDINQITNFEEISGIGAHLFLIGVFVFLRLAFTLFWGVAYLLVWLVFRFAKIRRLHREQLPLLSILVGTICYILFFSNMWIDYEYIQMGISNINTFLWLLIAFAGSILLRVKPEQIRRSVLLYLPLFVVAFVIIVARNTFVPDSLLVLIVPPMMLLVSIRQLLCCIFLRGKAPSEDSRLGWVSLGVYVTVFAFAWAGYTFVGLLIFVLWYFQLAILLTVVCISQLLNRYKVQRLTKRVRAMRMRITYVSGEEREKLLFGATWFYDLIREVAIPILVILSLPIGIRLSLNIFDFDDLFVQYYNRPFVSLTGEDGRAMMCISAQSIVFLFSLFLVFRYLNRAIHTLWQYGRYKMYMLKNNRTRIRPNEINLSLGNSIISVVIWMIYLTVFFVKWQIPTGSLGLVAGGLSAGIGLALKDVINNFIYGLQLLGGKLRVGDWIECDGVRGKVTSINYQCVQVETIDGTEVSFLNASLFGNNFNNLTRNNSYELIELTVGLTQGTNIQQVRETLVDAMQELRTKDRYGREVVEPQYGFNVVVNNMNDGSVTIGVKQYVLVAEMVDYTDRAKEVMYNALRNVGITIASPQCDIHIV